MSNGSGRRRSPLTTLVLLLVALLTGGAVVYAAMRGGDDTADTSASNSDTTSSEAATTGAEESTTEETTTSAESSSAESSSGESTTTSADSTTSTSATSTERSATTTAGPPSTELASLQAVGDPKPSAGEATVDGRTYNDSLTAPIGGCDTNGAFSYDLAGDYQTFTTTVGTTEDSKSDSVVRFEVYTDDELVYTSGNLRQGETDDIDIPVDNAQTLRLGYLFIDGDLSRCSDAGEVVWGDPVLTE